MERDGNMDPDLFLDIHTKKHDSKVVFSSKKLFFQNSRTNNRTG